MRIRNKDPFDSPPDSPSDSDGYLSIVPHAVAEESGSHTRFQLPDEGWIVEKVPRRRGSYVDKYYIEEVSGKKFRSLKEVERYIESGEYPSQSRPRSRKYPSKSRLKSIEYPSRSTEIVCFQRPSPSPSPRYAKRYIKRGGKVIRLDEEAYHQKQPSIVKSIGKTRLPFTDLPDGWVIEVVPRRLGGSDKYYIEEGSGRKFRSLKEVKRYIESGEYPSKSNLKCRKYPSKSRLKYPSRSTEIVCFKRPSPSPRTKRYIIRGGKVIRLDEEAYHQKQPSNVKSIGKARLPFTDLPDGWVIEVVPRRSGGSDKYYYEPGTGLGFRSFLAVSRHLEDKIPLSVYIEEIKENIPLSKAFKYKGKKMSRKRELTSSEDDGQTSPPPFGIAPKKMKWVLGSNGGDVWYPFIFETPVPDSVKQQWNERFINMMKNDGNQHSSSDILYTRAFSS